MQHALATATAQLEAGTARLTGLDELNQRLKQATAEIATQAALLQDAETRLVQVEGLNQQVQQLIAEVASTTAAFESARSKAVQLEETNNQLQTANEKEIAQGVALREHVSKLEADLGVLRENTKAELARVEQEKRLAIEQASATVESNKEAEQVKVEVVKREAAVREEELNKLIETRTKEHQKTVRLVVSLENHLC